MLIKKLILLIGCIAMAICAHAQGLKPYEDIKFINISLKQGLTQSSVLCILQDRKGYIWSGTRDGLNKYDGVKFAKYKYSSRDSNSLSHNMVRAICEDEYGNLWIGTASGLNRYDERADRFVRHPLFELGQKKQDEILCLAADGKGSIWIGTIQGLFKLNVKSGKKVFYQYQQKMQNGLSANYVQALLKTPDGDMWICTTNGIDQYQPGLNNFVHYQFPEGLFSNANFIASLYQDKQQNLWLGYKGGLALFNKKNKVFEQYHIGGNKVKDPVRAIREDDHHNLWIGTYSGLYILNIANQSIRQYQHDENNSSSLSQNSVYSICKDRMGDMWVGTYFGGINYYSNSYNRFKHVPVGNNNRMLNYKVVSSIIEDGSHNLWIGTEGGGINFYNKKTGLFTYYRHQENDPNSLSADNVKAMLLDKTGGLWIGLHDGGLDYLNTNHKPYQFEKINSGTDHGSLSNNRVVTLFQDEMGFIWVGTSGGGLNRLDPSSGAITQIPISSKGIGNIIYTMSASARKGKFLVGSNYGLSEMDVNTLQSQRINFNTDVDHTRSPVLSVNIKGDDELWVGTEGDGLYNYHLRAKKSKHYGISEGMPNDVIFGILPDAQNNLWLSTNNGLAQLQVHSGKIRSFDESDGLQSREFNYGASMRNQMGLLYFGGTNGFNFFNPAQITVNTYIPPVYITAIKVNNQLIQWDGTQEIELSHDENMLNFTFVALNYSQAQKNQYSAQLQGFDPKWNDLGNTNTLTYTNLDAGTYTLMVKASNNDGVWNKVPTILKIRIHPPLWKTWWAYVFYFILLSALIYYVLRFTRRQQKLETELYYEHINSERQQELYQMKLDFFTRISHEIRTPLTLIFAPLEKLIKTTGEHLTINHQLQGIKKNTDRLLRLISELLDFRKIESGNVTLKVSENDLVAFCQQIYGTYLSLAELKNINYQFKCKEKMLLVYFDAGQMEKVCFNMLSNAFKFTPDNGEIIFSVEEENGFAKIVIEDSGIGIPVAMQDKIFTNFFQVKSETASAEGWGIGLALVKNVVDLHKGEIVVASRPAHGGKSGMTKLTVTLQLGKAHFIAEQITTNPALLPVVNEVPIDVEMVSEPSLPEIVDERRKTVLVVEDNVELRHFIVQSLKHTYNILEGENGLKGWEAANEHVPDLIVSDVTMPQMNGFELCQKLKQAETTNHIPVIMLTAMAAQLHQVDGLEAGADVYITKPFSIQVLELSIRNLLQGRDELKQKYMRQIMLSPRKLETTSPEEKFLNKLMQLIEDHMEDPEFNVAGLVDYMGMSQTVLYKKIKVLTGLSITDFIKSQRLKRAAQLLTDNNMNIAEVAYTVGFNDRKYFSKEFRKQFGMAPSDYQQKKD